MLKNFDNFFNKSMEYTDFFGKQISHEEALQDRIRDLIAQIIMDEKKISEKSFTQVDQIIKTVKNVCDSNKQIYEIVEILYSKGKRLQYCAEIMYDKHFK